MPRFNMRDVAQGLCVGPQCLALYHYTPPVAQTKNPFSHAQLGLVSKRAISSCVMMNRAISGGWQPHIASRMMDEDLLLIIAKEPFFKICDVL
jgi:hypothetical protein